MAELVWSSCTAHTAAMLRMPEGTDVAQAGRVFDAFAHLNRALKAAAPDVLVIVATDHMMTFSYEAVPVFAIGTGDAFPSWGEAGTPKRTFRGHGDFGDAVVEGMIAGDFDVVSVGEMRLDHAFSCPLSFLMRDIDIPILPIYVNCTVPPLPSHARCRAFGARLGQVIRAQAAAPRVALVGTGGISHWVGMPQTGQINDGFDRRFLDLFEAGDLDAIVALDSDRVIADAGNGAAEIRNWLIAAAATGGTGATRLAYEPVAAWKTGIGLVELTAA
jgi:aromatic ring-opening dioxygenase catalytic subunit (LigB family)